MKNHLKYRGYILKFRSNYFDTKCLKCKVYTPKSSSKYYYLCEIRSIHEKISCIPKIVSIKITNKSIRSFKNSDGVVVGSEICKEITRSLNNGQNPVTNVSKLVNKLKKRTL